MGIREKYVEERFNRYFIYGEDKVSGRVDVSGANWDIICGVFKDDAEYLIKERDRAVDMIHKLACALDDVAPEVFKDLWYNGK